MYVSLEIVNPMMMYQISLINKEIVIEQELRKNNLLVLLIEYDPL